MSRFLLFIFILLIAIPSKGMLNPIVELNLLTKSFSEEDIRKSLLSSKQWVPYPDYKDRHGWNALTRSVYNTLIEEGEASLHYQWQVVKATDYLAFERDGSRVIMEMPMNENAKALSKLFLAELAEGKGRFLDQIINGVWYFTEMSTWSLSAHVPGYQSSKRSLPQSDTHVVDLVAGDMGSMLSWIHYFFKTEMDKVNPEIASRLKTHIKARVIQPYLTRNDMWWQAFDITPAQVVNNWNPWCNFNVLTCLLLIEDNEQQKVAGIYKTMQSVDKFINYIKHDGACEEGPSYWGHAAGKLYDYLKILSLATGDKVNFFDQQMIKDMGEYIAQSYIGGDSWVVNFADASAKSTADPLLIYRYGRSVNSKEMQRFAKYLHDKEPTKFRFGRDAFRSLEDLATFQHIALESASNPTNAYKWYPETEFLYIRDQNLFFAAKGGFNKESHNHNDVGSFLLFLDGQPVSIDAGVGTYNKKTFSKERYDIWTMQSDYHNLPRINGYQQRFGAQYKSQNNRFDAKKREFELDIAGAYPKEAQINSWIRKYRVEDKSLLITEQFDIENPQTEHVIHFLLAKEPRLKTGIVELNDGAYALSYDKSLFDASVEAIEQDDIRLSKVWGNQIYRLSLKAKTKTKKGIYRFSIK